MHPYSQLWITQAFIPIKCQKITKVIITMLPIRYFRNRKLKGNF